jgi:PilZ domain
MGETEAAVQNRRGRERYRVHSPVTVMLGDRKVPAFTRDLSNRGAYFYLSLADNPQVDQEIEFVIELPPEVTLSGWCRILCQGRVLRVEQTSWNETGVAAEIYRHSVLDGENPEHWGTKEKV